MYDLFAAKSKTAIDLYNLSHEPGNSWQQNYGFVEYRPDESWRGNKVRRFEIQPIIDVGRLPEFHYLPYSQVEKLVSYFENSELELPDWLKCQIFIFHLGISRSYSRNTRRNLKILNLWHL